MLYIDGMNGGYQTSCSGLAHWRLQRYEHRTNLSWVYTVSFPGGMQIDLQGGPDRLLRQGEYLQVVDTFDPPVGQLLSESQGVDNAADGIDLPRGHRNTCFG